MHVLLISFDPSVIDTKSPTFARMKAYAAFCDSLRIVCLGDAGQNKEVHEENIVARGFKGGSVRRLWGTARTVYAWTRQHAIDVISAQEPFESGLIALMVARKRGCASEVQLHGDFYSNEFFKSESWLNAVRWRLGVYVLKRVDGVRAVSQRIALSLTKLGIPEDRVITIPVYTPHTQADEKRVEQLKSAYPYPQRIVCVARLTKEKGVTTLAQAVPYVTGTFPGAHILIVGEGEQKEAIAATTKSLGVAEHVHFVGHVANPADFYAIADVVVIPSHTEGWSRVAVEAAYAQRPIVMTDVGCAGEVITHKKEGLIVPTNQPGACAEAIIYMLEHKEEARRMGTQAYKNIQALPTKDACVEEITRQWKRLTQHTNPA